MLYTWNLHRNDETHLVSTRILMINSIWVVLMIFLQNVLFIRWRWWWGDKISFVMVICFYNLSENFFEMLTQKRSLDLVPFTPLLCSTTVWITIFDIAFFANVTFLTEHTHSTRCTDIFKGWMGVSHCCSWNMLSIFRVKLLITYFAHLRWEAIAKQQIGTYLNRKHCIEH